jgi:aldehyde:ferredoxin oxidoreductase
MAVGCGFWLKNLRINLTDRTVVVEEIQEEFLKEFIGGAGAAAVYLKREVPPECGALDPGNLLIFATGPFQSSKISGSAKFTVATRSPLTGMFVDSAAGANWGILFKRTGFDFLTISGKSSTPVYLNITDNHVEILPADDLWGMDALSVTDKLKELYSGASVTAIGPAGENQVALSCMMVDGFSAVGRGGTGAVAGSKNLKAIVVKGTQTPPVADPEGLKELEKEYRKSILENAAGFRAGGTIGGLAPGEEAGNLPVKNWGESEWKEGAAKIGYPGYNELNPKPHACMYCTVACHRTVEKEFDDGYTYKGSGPEYESLALLGASCMIDDLEILVKANQFCNQAGMDTMSAGNCAAFAMEALEKGDTKGETPDYPFSWGDGEGLLSFLKEMSEGKGFGGIFSKGIRKGAEAFIPEAAEYAHHVKGMDIPAHDPRAYYNLSLSYATGNRGACHMRAYSQIATMGALLPEAGIDKAPAPDTLEGSAHVVKVYQDFTSFYNSCVMCQFMIWGGYGLGDMVKSLNAITGWDMSVEDVMKAGDRIFTIQRVLNNAWGISAADDTIPKRFFVPAKTGGRAGKYPADFKQELKKLYAERGWEANGFPGKDKIESLGIDKWI